MALKSSLKSEQQWGINNWSCPFSLQEGGAGHICIQALHSEHWGQEKILILGAANEPELLERDPVTLLAQRELGGSWEGKPGERG